MLRSVRIWLVILAPSILGCRGQEKPRRVVSDMPSQGEHALLNASFVSGDSAALRSLLHPDLIVQPPTPDSAQRGAAARSYILTIAANTKVAESSLHPRMVTPEGPFVFEQGVWRMRAGGRVVYSPYVLRWRATPEGLRIVLWRWGAFR